MKPGVGFWAGATAFGSAPFRVSQAGQLVCSNIQITGAGSTWGGAVFGTAYIPNLSTDKLTTGTLLVARTEAKCPTADADRTSTHTSADTSAVNGLASSRVSGWAHGSDTTKIDGGDIYTNTVTASKLYIDDDIQFYNGAVYHGITGLTSLWRSSTGSTTLPRVTMTATLVTVDSGTTAGNDVNIGATDQLLLDSRSGDVILTAGDDVRLEPTDDLALHPGGEIDLIATDQGAYVVSGVTVCSHSINVKLNSGTVYRLALIPAA